MSQIIARTLITAPYMFPVHEANPIGETHVALTYLDGEANEVIDNYLCADPVVLKAVQTEGMIVVAHVQPGTVPAAEGEIAEPELVSVEVSEKTPENVEAPAEPVQNAEEAAPTGETQAEAGTEAAAV